MRILLDTHILIWIHTNQKRLSQNILDIIQHPDNEIFYSSVNIWETQVKYLKDAGTFPISGEKLNELCRSAGMHSISLKPEHAVILKTLSYSAAAPRPHKDPFDRMLLCQAKYEGMYLLTHDELIPYYDEPCVIPV